MWLRWILCERSPWMVTSVFQPSTGFHPSARHHTPGQSLLVALPRCKHMRASASTPLPARHHTPGYSGRVTRAPAGVCAPAGTGHTDVSGMTVANEWGVAHPSAWHPAAWHTPRRQPAPSCLLTVSLLSPLPPPPHPHPQPSADAEPVTRPLKVEEGLLLNVLQVAASKGHVPLAEAVWQVCSCPLKQCWAGMAGCLVWWALLAYRLAARQTDEPTASHVSRRRDQDSPKSATLSPQPPTHPPSHPSYRCWSGQWRCTTPQAPPC